MGAYTTDPKMGDGHLLGVGNFLCVVIVHVRILHNTLHIVIVHDLILHNTLHIVIVHDLILHNTLHIVIVHDLILHNTLHIVIPHVRILHNTLHIVIVHGRTHSLTTSSLQSTVIVHVSFLSQPEHKGWGGGGGCSLRTTMNLCWTLG